MWAVNSIAPAGMHILCIGLRYNAQSKPENHKVSYLLRFYDKTGASFLTLAFRYFELQNIYKRILNRIRIPKFRQWVGSCIDIKGIIIYGS